jgi:hypothetical protein
MGTGQPPVLTHSGTSHMRTLVLAVLLAFAGAAHPETSFSTDVSDLWWNPDESGWGINLVQQNDTVFATLFVYDSNMRAHWYVGSDLSAQSASSSGASFQGDLFETQGLFFGVPFNPSAVSAKKVGAVTLQIAFPSSGTLTYSVNGVTVTKAIRRQTWALNDATGSYDGFRVIVSASGGTGCGPNTNSFSFLQVLQGPDLRMNWTFDRNAVCRSAGTYSEEGHLGSSSGSFSCDDGRQGTYTLSELETTLYGFSARYNGTENGCTIQGRIGGVRTTIKRTRAE